MKRKENNGKRKGAVNKVLSWFGVGEKGETPPLPPSGETDKGGDGDESPALSKTFDGYSPNAQNISDRVLTLKKSFEFEEELEKRLEDIANARELLIFIQDVLVFRFDQLHKIGLISPDSYRFIASLSDKVASMTLSRKERNEVSPEAMEELRGENRQLKQRIENIQSKYVKTGIVTDTELAKDHEIARLNAHIRNQHSQMKIARKRLEALASYQEMVQTLRIRNRFLKSKADQQAHLLRSITVNNPEQEEVLGAVHKLSKENKQLKRDLERQSHLLNQLREHIPPDARTVVDALLKSNSTLWEDLEDKDAQLAAAFASGRDIHEHLDELRERNYQLKQTLETTQKIDRYMQERGEGVTDFNGIIEMLKLENDRLQQSLAAKDEQIQSMTAEPASRKLMAAHRRLQNEYREVVKENQLKDQLYRQEVTQREGLMSQARERSALIKENQRLKADLESTRQTAQSRKLYEQQFLEIKKANSELEIRHQRVTAELDEAKKKLSRITAEYKLLMDEYENLFGKS